MATPQIQSQPTQKSNYLNAEYGIKSWLLTTDHKRIAILYLIGLTLFFIVGGFMAFLIRLHLLTPEGWVGSADDYNRYFSLHGTIMVWFFLIPSIPAVFGNFLIPLMIGARDVAFPKLNLMSWYMFMISGFVALVGSSLGGTDVGWTFYPPLSTAYSNSHIFWLATAVFITGFSTIITAINFIVTIHTMRAPGMKWFRLPLFIWSMYATAAMIVLATPVLAISLLLIMLQRLFHVGIFDPTLGGDPVLYQHLFWFYSHPAVYIMIVPGLGYVSEAIACFSRKRIFGYVFVAFASIAIAMLSFLIWGHHMFVSGMSVYSGMAFSTITFMISVPSAIKVFNWTATLYKGSISLDAPMLYALGFIVLFTLGGMGGLFLATLAVDVHVHDTYFVIAHFHFIMVGGMLMGYIGGLHFWWPKATGRMYSEFWGRLAASTTIVGFILTFLPQFMLGYMGMNRRYASYSPEFQPLNVASSAGASILGVGYLMPVIYLLLSLRYGKKAGPNPWKATGLEWTTESPPPKHNFASIPVVTEEPYSYHLRQTQRT